MVKVVEDEKRVMTEREVDAEFDGHWVLLYERPFPAHEDRGYLIAYGDGSTEDREALRELNFDRFDGTALVTKGYKPKPGVHDCYGVYNS